MWFWFGSNEQRISGGLREIAKRLRKYFKKCPACQLNFKEHKFAELAITIMAESNEDRVEAFLSVVRQHKWEEVLTFSEFDKFEDALVVRIIKCPSEKAIWVITREPYSLDDPYQIAEFEVLNPTKSQNLLALIAEDKWVDLA